MVSRAVGAVALFVLAASSAFDRLCDFVSAARLSEAALLLDRSSVRARRMLAEQVRLARIQGFGEQVAGLVADG